MLEYYIKYLKGSHKSNNTIEAYKKDIIHFLSFVNKKEEEIEEKDLINWQDHISSLSSATIARKIVSIKNYFNFLYECKYISYNPTSILKSPKVQNKEKQYISPEEIKKMIECARTSRDKAILLMFVTTGVRVSELVNITLEEYYTSREIKIVGKGNKERTIYINDATKEAIDKYLKERRPDNCDKLFASFQGGKIHSNNLSQTLKKIALKAGLDCWKEISNHWLRMCAASIQAENGTPVNVIKDMLGHSSLAVTSRYIKSSKNAVKDAIMKTNL